MAMGVDEDRPNLAHLKMLVSEDLARKLEEFTADLRVGKDDTDEVWCNRFDAALRWLLPDPDLGRAWRIVLDETAAKPQIVVEDETGDRKIMLEMRPWKNRDIWESFLRDIYATIGGIVKGDVLSQTAFARGKPEFTTRMEVTNLYTLLKGDLARRDKRLKQKLGR